MFFKSKVNTVCKAIRTEITAFMRCNSENGPQAIRDSYQKTAKYVKSLFGQMKAPCVSFPFRFRTGFCSPVCSTANLYFDIHSALQYV